MDLYENEKNLVRKISKNVSKRKKNKKAIFKFFNIKLLFYFILQFHKKYSIIYLRPFFVPQLWAQ